MEGKKVYKSTCLKNISANQKLSKDRLRRVRGMSKYPDKTPADEIDLNLLIGDSVLIVNDQPIIANIVEMKKANVSLNLINISQGTENMKDVEFTLRKIDTELINGKLFWKGTASGEDLKCVGEACLPIKPSIEADPPEGLTRFFFDFNLMNDLGVHLRLLSENTGIALNQDGVVKKKCFKCQKLIDLSDMRLHIGIHILKRDLTGASVCGFCGRNGCLTTMHRTSKKGPNEVYTLDKSDCASFYRYNRSKKFNSKTNPCTNRMERCPVNGCLADVWKYNFSIHFYEKHQGKEFPSKMVISDEEKAFLRAK